VSDAPVTPPEAPPPPSSAPPRRGGWYLDRSRLRLGIVIGLIAGALSFLLLQGLGQATMYFYNADEAVERRESLGERPFRLQGVVLPGSLDVDDGAVRFEVGHGGEVVEVHHAGDPPELFREGIPVVLEGRFVEGSRPYRSDRIMVRHTEEYKATDGDGVYDDYEAEHPDRVDGVDSGGTAGVDSRGTAGAGTP
jgi:cytochrome c-type biogenesis protein CcmE